MSPAIAPTSSVTAASAVSKRNQKPVPSAGTPQRCSLFCNLGQQENLVQFGFGRSFQNTKSTTFGQPRCWSRTEAAKRAKAARARANTSSTDVTSSRNTESGIRFAYRIRFKDKARRESGILGSAVNEISCGENRNIRGMPSLSTGETLGPLVQLIELI